MSPSRHGMLWYLQSSSTYRCLTHKVKVGGAGFLCSAGRATLPSSPRPPVGILRWH